MVETARSILMFDPPGALASCCEVRFLGDEVSEVQDLLGCSTEGHYFVPSEVCKHIQIQIPGCM